MPIYLVRWPGSSLSIIKAQDKTELMDIIDEVGDPVRCRIKEYRGPLFISLNLKVEYKTGQGGETLLQDVSHCLKSPEFEFADDYGDTIDDMKNEILRFAFPAYHKYIKDRDPEREPDYMTNYYAKTHSNGILSSLWNLVSNAVSTRVSSWRMQWEF